MQVQELVEKIEQLEEARGQLQRKMSLQALPKPAAKPAAASVTSSSELKSSILQKVRSQWLHSPSQRGAFQLLPCHALDLSRMAGDQSYYGTENNRAEPERFMARHRGPLCAEINSHCPPWQCDAALESAPAVTFHLAALLVLLRLGGLQIRLASFDNGACKAPQAKVSACFRC